MQKESTQEYSLLDYFDIPRPQSHSNTNNKKPGSVRQITPLPKPQHLEIQLTLFDEIAGLP